MDARATAPMSVKPMSTSDKGEGSLDPNDDADRYRLTKAISAASTRGKLRETISGATFDGTVPKLTIDIDTRFLDAYYTKYRLKESLASGVKPAPKEFLDEFMTASNRDTLASIARPQASTQDQFMTAANQGTSTQVPQPQGNTHGDKTFSPGSVAYSTRGALVEMIEAEPGFLDERERVRSNWQASLARRGLSNQALGAFSKDHTKAAQAWYNPEDFVADENQHTLVYSGTRDTKITVDALDGLLSYARMRTQRAKAARASRLDKNPHLEGKSLISLGRDAAEQSKIARREEERSKAYRAEIDNKLDSELTKYEGMPEADFNAQASLTNMVYTPKLPPGSDDGQGGKIIPPETKVEYRFWRSKEPSAGTDDPTLVTEEEFDRMLAASMNAGSSSAGGLH